MSAEPANSASTPFPDGDAPLVTIDGLSITAAPGRPPSTSFHFVSSGSDFSLVMEGMGIELETGSEPLRSTLRCQLRASVVPPRGYRVTQVSGTVTGGGPHEPLDPTRATAAVRTQTTLGGVALPSTASSPAPGAQEDQRIPDTSIPALDQCSGQPLALDVRIEVEASRVDVNQVVTAHVDSYDLRFELTPCP